MRYAVSQLIERIMNLEKAGELADLRKAIKEAPASNPTFETLTSEQKVSELGERISRFATIKEGDHCSLRKFSASFLSGEGATVWFWISAYYKYDSTSGEIDPKSAHHIDATWSCDGSQFMVEAISGFSLRTNSPEDTENVLNRLEESVSAAESLHAQVAV
jgi:hypothetical protein